MMIGGMRLRDLVVAALAFAVVVVPLRGTLRRAYRSAGNPPVRAETRLWFKESLGGLVGESLEISEDGSRILFVRGDERAAGSDARRELWLFERGLGATRLSAEGELVRDRPALSRDGASAAYLAGASSGDSLRLWRAGRGTETLVENGFFGDWSIRLAGSGATVLLAPRGDARLARELGASTYQGGVLVFSTESASPPEELPLSPKAWAVTDSGVSAVETAEHGSAARLARASIRRSAIADDTDGDAAADLLLFRFSGSTSAFRGLRSSGLDGPARVATNRPAATIELSLRSAPAVPVVGDYDGDGSLDAALYQPLFSPAGAERANWRVFPGALSDQNAPELGFVWGSGEQRAVPADYDGDGKTDLAVFDPATAVWHIMYSGFGRDVAKAALALPGFGAAIQWGLPGDVPVPADYDGNGTADPAVVRTAPNGSLEWYIFLGEQGRATPPLVFGHAGDIPIPADYDGDGKSDLGVVRSDAWEVRLGGETARFPGCPARYAPLVRDYDGDGRGDRSCYGGSESPPWRITLSSVTDAGRRLFADKGPGEWFPELRGDGFAPSELVLRAHEQSR